MEHIDLDLWKTCKSSNEAREPLWLVGTLSWIWWWLLKLFCQRRAFAFLWGRSRAPLYHSCENFELIATNKRTFASSRFYRKIWLLILLLKLPYKLNIQHANMKICNNAKRRSSSLTRLSNSGDASGLSSYSNSCRGRFSSWPSSRSSLVLTDELWFW